jgi:CheY-like chemotaxis protein
VRVEAVARERRVRSESELAAQLLTGVPPLVVVADGDVEIRDAVSGFVSARGYRVEPAADAEAATRLLLTNTVDVLVSDLAMRSADGVGLLAFARASAPMTRSIALAANMTPFDRDAALRLGAIRALAKPLSGLELADAIDLARDCADGFHGWLHRMSLLDVLQMYHHAGQSLVLRVGGDVEGAVWFQLGELIHAECAGRSGAAALATLLTAQRGRLEASALVPTPRTITAPFDHVLLDGLRAIDERRASVAPVVDTWLDESSEYEVLDREALARWLAEHAPGAGLWRIDPSAPAIERLHGDSDPPEFASALAWAYELAELTDPTWTRVELISGPSAIALVRAPWVVLALVRLVTDDAIQRRFHLESAQLARWLHDQVKPPT